MENNQRFRGFDGLRAVSVLLVIASHLGLWSHFPPSIADRLVPVFGATAGVNLFFVISGFLITTLLLREKRDCGSIFIRLFLIRRALRLMPAFLLFIGSVGLCMLLGLIQPAGVALLISALYLYNFVPFGTLYTHELAHTWSLAIEEHFYLMWPWMLEKLKSVAITRISLILMVGCALGMLISTGSRSRWTIPGMAPIIIGCLLAIYHFALLPKRSNLWVPDSRTIGLAAVLLWLLPLFLPPIAAKLMYVPHIFGFGLALYWIYLNSDSGLVRILECRPLVYLGTISYGLYLWQGLFVTNGPDGKAWMQQFPQNIVLTLAAAMLSYHVLEMYFLRIKKRYVPDAPRSIRASDAGY